MTMTNDITDEIKLLSKTDKVICIKKNVPVRSFHGKVWRTMKTNKKYLARDFEHRCCYCDDLDEYNGKYESYAVDHFAPKSKFKDLEFDYDNLLYCCRMCNSSKSDKWVGVTAKENIVDNKGFIDPCMPEYYANLARKTNGEIIFLTELGKYMYYELKLYAKQHQTNYQINRLSEIKRRIDTLLKHSKLSLNEIKKLKRIRNEICDKILGYLGL